VLLGLVTLAVYARVSRHEFINYDDPDYITKNSMVQQVSLGRALRGPLPARNTRTGFP